MVWYRGHGLPLDLTRPFVGLVRKALGISLVGETRENEKMQIADCLLEGVQEQVRQL